MGYVTIDNTSDVKKKTSKSTSQQKQNMFWLILIRNKYVQSAIRYLQHNKICFSFINYGSKKRVPIY